VEAPAEREAAMTKKITADDIFEGVKKQKIQLFKVRLVKERTLKFPVDSIRGAEDLAKIARSEMAHLPHEEIIAIGLSGKNSPLGIVKISQGGISGAAMSPSDVMRPLLAMGASAFVLVHNHPSGDPTPSQDDVHMTRALKRAAECVGLSFLDHLIVGSVRGGSRWSSMREMVAGVF
jgi:DNA repair protein RadC